MPIVKTICYIYTVFYHSNIVYHLKARLKAAMLVVALLVSFFCISGYVSRPVATSAMATSGQAAAVRANVKAAIHYKRALLRIHNNPLEAAAIAKPKNISQRILANAFAARHVLLSTEFSALKHTFAYPVRHLSLSACNG